MIKLIKYSINTDIFDNIKNQVKNNPSIIITSSNALIEYKKYFCQFSNIQLVDLKSFIYQIYQKHINKFPILNSKEQILYFIKAIEKVGSNLSYLHNYSFDIIEDLMSLYKNETNHLLIKSNYKTKIIEDYELIKNNYFALLKNKYIDEQMLYLEVEKFLKENHIFKDIDIIISDIYYLNDIEQEIISNLVKQAKNGYLYFLDNIDAPGLEIHKKTYSYFSKIFDGVYEVETINQKVDLEKDFIFNNLYRLDYDTYNKSNYIKMYGASDLYDEVVFVTKQINYLIRTENMRFFDFAIVSNNILEYENYFDLIFSANKIPYHKEISINRNFFEFVLNLLDIIHSGVTKEKLVKILKSKYYKISEYQINQIINDEEIDIDLKNYLDTILKPLEINNKEVSLSEFLLKFYNYLEDFEIDIQVNKESRETWNEFVKILDSINNVYQNENITIIKFKEMLEYFFDKASVKEHYLDEVLVGNLSVLEARKPKVVFFIGVNEGVVPNKEKSNVILNINELSKYYQKYPKFNNILIDKFNTFYTFICPQKYLFLTYYKVGNDGSKANPAPLIDKIKKMYNELTVFTKKEIDELISFPVLTYNHHLTLENTLLKDYLKTYFDNQSNYYRYNKLIEKIPLFLNVESLNTNHIDKIYLSPSSIESYNNCPFQFFCKYILKIEEKEEFKYDNRIVGTYIHYLYEKLINNKAPRNNIKGLLKFWKQEFIKENNLKISAIIDYLFNQLNKNIETLWPFIYDEIKENKFKPKYLELNISSSNEFPSLVLNYKNIPIYLSGIIDRVDFYNNYVRVIDYKTGEKAINFNEIVHHLNLQLFLYLLYIKRANPNFIPASAFYMPSLLKYEQEKFDFKGYRLSGIILNNDEVIEGLGGKNINKYVVAYDAYNRFKKHVLIDEEDFNSLLDFTENAIIKTAQNILKGDIEIKPYKGSMICEYCIYKPICGIEKNSKNYRKIKKYSNEEIWSIIRGEKNEVDN